jgi:D-sedoheptulose 7-phosphate isomerase
LIVTSNTPQSQNSALAYDPVTDYLDQLEHAISQISREEIWVVVQVLFKAWQERRQIFLVGNGGSAATASHMANDLNKLTIVEGMPRMKAMALTDNVPLITAWSNDTSYENAFSEQLVNFIQPGDIVICISASGNSPNILRAIEVARQSEATVIGFTGQPGGKLRELADYSILIPDDHIGRQEDGHMILDHVISNSLRHLILNVNQPGGSK